MLKTFWIITLTVEMNYVPRKTRFWNAMMKEIYIFL